MREDPWLSERLGRTAWTVEPHDQAREVQAAGAGFYQAKVPCADVARVGDLEDLGFRVVDVNVTLGREPGPSGMAASPAIRDAVAADREAVLAIARDDYAVSRFHLDPAIDDDVAAAIKRDWADNWFAGRRGDRMLVAAAGEEVTGFHLIMLDDGRATIDLIAVASRARRSGTGRALVARLLDEEPDREVVVGTQVSNVAALRLYARLGFTARDTRYVLHRHA